MKHIKKTNGLLWVFIKCHDKGFIYYGSAWGDPEDSRYFNFLKNESQFSVYQLSFRGVWEAWKMCQMLGIETETDYDRWMLDK